MRRGESRVLVLRRTHSNSHLSVRAMFLHLMSPNVTTRDKPDHAEQCTFRRGLGLTESHPPRLPHRSWQQRSHSLCATSKTDGLCTVLLRSLSFLEGVPSGSIFESFMYRYHLLNYHRTGECPSLGSSLLRFRVVGKLNLKRELRHPALLGPLVHASSALGRDYSQIDMWIQTTTDLVLSILADC